MDNQPATGPTSSEFRDLQRECESLRQSVSSLMLVLILVSGTLSVYLWRQVRVTKGELQALAPQAAQQLKEYTNAYSLTQDFGRKLAEYGRTHPDFGPIMLKYNLNNLLQKPGEAAPASPAPGVLTNR
ncbi:MAG TPA: hypothetical protein VKY92_11285 [Verrucomicrobiae bacterium]|jgi:hypothetical protein|nr:hypothetical protein [Verrucomicrobiae bacterium]